MPALLVWGARLKPYALLTGCAGLRISPATTSLELTSALANGAIVAVVCVLYLCIGLIQPSIDKPAWVHVIAWWVVAASATCQACGSHGPSVVCWHSHVGPCALVHAACANYNSSHSLSGCAYAALLPTVVLADCIHDSYPGCALALQCVE